MLLLTLYMRPPHPARTGRLFFCPVYDYQSFCLLTAYAQYAILFLSVNELTKQKSQRQRNER